MKIIKILIIIVFTLSLIITILFYKGKKFFIAKEMYQNKSLNNSLFMVLHNPDKLMDIEQHRNKNKELHNLFTLSKHKYIKDNYLLRNIHEKFMVEINKDSSKNLKAVNNRKGKSSEDLNAIVVPPLMIDLSK